MISLASQQTTDSVLMIRPFRFGWNAETAASNSYQAPPSVPSDQVHTRALREFDGLRDQLEQAGVRVTVLSDLPTPHTPDSLFPNNWFSTHDDGTLALYPMATPSRRAERRPHIIEALRSLGFLRTVDLRPHEDHERFLEGTGSLVLDRQARIAYAAVSLRTHPAVVADFAQALGYRSVIFSTQTAQGQPVYHTNVLMSVGRTIAVICLDAIADSGQRRAVEAELARSGREILPISIAQMNEFAGNLLELRSQHGTAIWVLSSRAHAALLPEQRTRLSRDARLVHAPLPTIEAIGGGSARCMLAELFHPPEWHAHAEPVRRPG